MIIVIGSIIAKPEDAKSILDLSIEHVERSRRETGCMQHNVSVDSENCLRFVFVEYWTDMKALQVHFELKESIAFVKAISGMVSAAPEMKIFEATELSQQ